MNGMDLLNGMGCIDEKLVEEGEQRTLKKPAIRWMLPLAACFAVIVIAASFLPMNQTPPPTAGGEPAEPPTAGNEQTGTLFGDTADSGRGEDGKTDYCPPLGGEQLTQQQAYAQPKFGAYLPKIPADYGFNSAVAVADKTGDRLFASWSRGHEDFTVHISELGQEDKSRIVAVEDTSLYDMSLYPIPWCDSMPPDKAPIIENPIFKAEDLTVDLIRLREYIRGEQNDPSGNSVNLHFSVLYGDILVAVTTEGVSAQTLFDALSVLPRT